MMTLDDKKIEKRDSKVNECRRRFPHSDDTDLFISADSCNYLGQGCWLHKEHTKREMKE